MQPFWREQTSESFAGRESSFLILPLLLGENEAVLRVFGQCSFRSKVQLACPNSGRLTCHFAYLLVLITFPPHKLGHFQWSNLLPRSRYPLTKKREDMKGKKNIY